MKDIFVGVQPVPIIKRAKQLPPWEADSYPHVFQPVSLIEALNREWETDAHFVPYFVDGEEEWPAMAKNMLGLIRNEGSDVLTRLLVIDFDTVPHDPWSRHEGLLEQFSDRMEQIKNEGKIPFPQILYTTTKGARGIFVLSEPVSVAQAEPMTRGLVEAWWGALAHVSVKPDKLHNWDRCFRLPKVVRGGRRTSNLQSFHLLVASDQEPFPPDDLPSSGPAACTKGGVPLELDLPMPTPEDVEGILWTQGSRERVRRSDWWKLAKSRLRGREYYHACFDEDCPPPEEGSRDIEIQRAAGGVVAMCHGLESASPEKCFALLFHWVDQIHPETCQVPPRDNLWRAVLKYWAKEAAKAEDEEQESLSTIDQIVKGMRSYDPGVPQDGEEAREYASERMLAYSSGNAIYLIKKNGFYSSVPVDRYFLRAHIRREEMEAFIALEEVEGNRVVELTSSQILERHGFKVAQEIAQMGMEGGARLRIEEDDSVSLVHPTVRERGLVPEYHPEVDAWLHKMFDKDYPKVEQWLANAVDLSEGKPICALSIVGPPGCGKGLLVRGLSECFYPSNVVGAEAFQQFNEPLLHSAVVCIDEGFPASLQKGGIPDIFRSLVSGEPTSVQRKQRPSVSFRGALRVVMTSNGMNLLEAVVGDGSLSWEDSQALGQRLLSVHAMRAGSDYLEGLGGINHTAKKGARWVAPPGSGDSDYIIAKHIYWLKENRMQLGERGVRFLVEGDPLAEYLQASKIVSEEGDAVLASIMALVNYTHKEALDGYAETDEGVYVTITEIMNIAERNRKHIGSARKVAKVLQSFCGGKSARAKMSVLLPNGSKSDRKTFYFLDGALLYQAANSMGYNTRHLEKMVKQ